ncbi:MAG: hypothetical protein RLY86_487 [Pseudomonadota bacterium]
MRTDEIKLLAAADALARAHPPKHAVILDLSGVLHIDEPVFHRTLSRWLGGVEGPRPAGADGGGAGKGGASQGGASQGGDGGDAGSGGVAAFELSHGRLALVIDDGVLPVRRAALARVAGVLAEHRRGAMRARWFSLAQPGEAEAFAAAVRDLARDAAGGDRPGDLPTDDAMDRFLAMERSLHAVDLSGLVRQLPVYRIDPGTMPRIVMLELTVSIPEIERLFGLRLADDPWLYGRVTELLDRRMLYHLARDRDDHPLPLAVKMHAATVAGAEFTTRIAALPAKRHGRLVVELPWLEWEQDREMVVAAISAARRMDLGIALDHVPMTAVRSGDLPEVDLYRILGRDDGGTAADLGEAAGPWVEKLGATRCLLARCTEAQMITDGLAAGIRLFEGKAVDRMAADHVRSAQEKRAEEIVRDDATDSRRERPDGTGDGDKGDDEGSATGTGLMAWIRRRLGGG